MGVTREPQRIEPMLSTAFVGRDFVNRKDKMMDLTEPTSTPCRYSTAALWVLFGFLAIWVWINL